MGKKGNGEGSVRRNVARDRWEARLTVGLDERGRPVRRMVTGATEAEVKRRLRDLRAATAQGLAPARRDVTVGWFVNDWLDNVLPGTVSLATEELYRTAARLYIVPFLGRKRLVQLTARDVSKWLRELETAPPPPGSHRDHPGVSPNTRRIVRSVLRLALRWAEHEGLVLRNVAAIAPGPRIGTPEGRTLNPGQARVLLDHVAGHRLAAAFTVALALGLRRGELLGLAWDDVDLDAKPPKLTVRRALVRVPGVGRSEPGGGLLLTDTKTPKSRRTLMLPAIVVDTLRAHRVRQAEERLLLGAEWTARPLGADLVFRTPLGTAVDPDNFTKTVYAATEAAGLGRWSPHELRHSAASLLLAQGVPLKTVSETLGHASIRVTSDVYGHLLDEGRIVAADAMERALAGVAARSSAEA